MTKNLEDEVYMLKMAIAGGEDAPGSIDLLTTLDACKVANQMIRDREEMLMTIRGLGQIIREAGLREPTSTEVVYAARREAMQNEP